MICIQNGSIVVISELALLNVSITPYLSHSVPNEDFYVWQMCMQLFTVSVLRMTNALLK